MYSVRLRLWSTSYAGSSQITMCYPWVLPALSSILKVGFNNTRTCYTLDSRSGGATSDGFLELQSELSSSLCSYYVLRYPLECRWSYTCRVAILEPGSDVHWMLTFSSSIDPCYKSTGWRRWGKLLGLWKPRCKFNCPFTSLAAQRNVWTRSHLDPQTQLTLKCSG